MNKQSSHRLFGMKFGKVYPLYVQKAERKNRTKEEVDRIICWLTGYDQAGLQQQIEQENDFETFFAQAPALHPNRSLIKGVVCGVRVEEPGAKLRYFPSPQPLAFGTLRSPGGRGALKRRFGKSPSPPGRAEGEG